MNLSGCGTAIVTPFRGDGSLDEPSLAALVEWQIRSGIRFLVACGTTGETPTLSEEEWLRAVQVVADVSAGRVPVLAGCTHNATREAAERARRVASLKGVYGLLTANPFYNKPNQEGQYRHFRTIAEAVSCPVVLYNIPSRTGTNLEPATVLRLASDVANIQGIKESSGSVQQISDLLNLLPKDFVVLSGDDGMALPVIGMGGAGLVSVASNEIPSEMTRMVDAALNGEWEAARTIFRRYSRLIAANFWESSPGPVKCVLAMMGRLEEIYRLPMVPVSAATRAKLAPLVEELGLLPQMAAASKGDASSR